MKKLFIYILCGLIFNVYAKGQVTSSKITSRSYAGTIGPYKVSMNLRTWGDSASGEYIYSSSGAAIDCKGSFINNRLELKESYNKLIWGNHDSDDENLFKGIFSANLDNNGNLSGSVKYEAGNKEAYRISLLKNFEVSYADSSLRMDYNNQDPKIKLDIIYSLEMKDFQFINLENKKNQKDINSLYRYNIVTYADKNHIKSLDQIPEKKLAEFGIPDGKTIVARSSKIKNPGFPYSYSNRNDLIYIDSHVMSVENSVVEYNGAPHEFSQYTFDNIDVVTAKNITLDDILIPGQKFMLDSMGDFCFRQQMGLGPNADFRTSGYFFKYNLFHAGTNFYFTIHGLCFLFNKYDISSYNAGVIRVLIPYSMIKSIIKPEGPLSYVLYE